MGNSPSAVLAYGFDLGAEEEFDDFPEEVLDDWKEQYIKKIHPDWIPKEEYPSLERYYQKKPPTKDKRIPTEEEKKIIEEYNEYWKKKREFLKEINCDIESYGIDGYHSYAITIKDSKYGCEWNAVTIYPESLIVGKGWERNLWDFCNVLKIPIGLKNPGWLLMASYG